MEILDEIALFFYCVNGFDGGRCCSGATAASEHAAGSGEGADCANWRLDADEERRRLGRERFKVYRDLKLPLETHQMDETADV